MAKWRKAHDVEDNDFTVKFVPDSTSSKIMLRCFITNDCDKMTPESNGPDGNREHSNRLVRAKTYRHGWNSDLQALSKFVKEQVFYVVVHDFKNESDDPLDVNTGAICQNLF